MMNYEQHKTADDARAARFKHTPNTKPLEGYTLKRGIGIGGFGEVYFAVSDAGKEVALKRIQRNLDVELRGVQNCLNLKHINLISLWDIRTDATGDSWVVMEYVPGPSLRDIIEVSETGMPDHQIQRWFSPIIDGVGYLHQSGLVHRDLKPANIFLDEDASVIKIGDYGLTKYISGSQGSRQTQAVGTFHYMAPEIGNGSYGKGIDIYAMGIVLFEMLTGDVPFCGESSQEIIMKHLTANPDFSAIPSQYREAIERALLKDPEIRFSTVEEFRACLPWAVGFDSSNVINSDRFNLRKTVAPDSNGRLSAADNNVPNILEQSRSEAGILFGPLVQSEGGANDHQQNKNDDVVYIDSNHAANSGTADPSVVAATNAAVAPVKTPQKTEPVPIPDWWNDTSISTPLKAFGLLTVTMGIVLNPQWLLAVALGLGLVYLVCYGVYNIFFSPLERDLQPKKLDQRRQRQILQTAIRQQIGQLDFLTRASSVTGSLLAAASVCLALNLLGMAVVDSIFESQIDSLSKFTWSTVVSVVGSWSVLLIGKYYERTDENWHQQRSAVLTAGVLIGGLSLLLCSYLNVDLKNSVLTGSIQIPLVESISSKVTPLLANILFFTGVFGFFRWCRQVAPGRRTRLSVVAVGLHLVAGVLLSYLLNFAPMFATFTVVVISIASQLSAEWVTHEERRVILESQPASQ